MKRRKLKIFKTVRKKEKKSVCVCVRGEHCVRACSNVYKRVCDRKVGCGEEA